MIAFVRQYRLYRTVFADRKARPLSSRRDHAEAPALKIVVLTNTRQADRHKGYVPDHAPNPRLEFFHLRQNGIEPRLRDRLGFPWNPLARAHVLFAGIDPLRALRVLLFDRKADAVLCVYESTALLILALRKLLRFAPPVFLLEVSERGWRPRDRILDFVMPRVDQVLTLTAHSKGYAERCYRLKRPAIVVGYAVDEMFFRPGAEAGPEEPEGGYILAVGDDHSRDYAVLLEACAPLEVRLVLRTRLPVSVPAAMRDRVEVIAEPVSYRRLRELYRGARLVVLPLRATDNPGGITSLFEAMAMGKAVVCSDTGTTRDVVAHSGNALLVSAEEPEALRASILRLWQDKDEATRLATAARGRIEREHSSARRVERIASAIRNLKSSPATDARPSGVLKHADVPR